MADKHIHRTTPLQGILRILRNTENNLLDNWQQELITVIKKQFSDRILNDDLNTTIGEIKKMTLPRFSLVIEGLDQELPFQELNKTANKEMEILVELCKSITDLFTSRENMNLAFQDALKAKNMIDQRILEGKQEIEELLDLLRYDIEKEIETFDEKMKRLQKIEEETNQLGEQVKKRLENLQNFLKKIVRIKENYSRNNTLEQFEKKILDDLALLKEADDGLTGSTKKISKELFQLQMSNSRLKSQIQAIDRIIDLWRKPSELQPPSTDWTKEVGWLQQVQKRLEEIPPQQKLQIELNNIEEEISQQDIFITTSVGTKEYSLTEKALAALITYGVTEGRGRRPATIVEVCERSGLIAREDVNKLKTEIEEGCKGGKALFTQVLVEGRNGFICINIQPSPYGKIVAQKIVQEIITPGIKEKIMQIKKEKNKKFSERRVKKR